MDVSVQPFLQITGGQLSDVELAALTAVLLARVRVPEEAPVKAFRSPRPVVHRHRPRRPTFYNSPVSWRESAAA